MSILRRVPFAAAFLAATVAACEPAGVDQIIEIEAGGVVQGIVLRDLNASNSLDAADEPAVDVPVSLVLFGTSDTVARTRTNAGGAFAFPRLPVGRYVVEIPAGALGDSLAIVYRDPPGAPVDDIDSADEMAVTLGADDTTDVGIGIAYPVVSIAAARSLPVGRRVFVRAVAIASSTSIVPGTLFVQDATGAIAAFDMPANSLVAQDSVLVLGTTDTQSGRRILADATALLLDTGVDLDTVTLVAGSARTADDGEHDADLARLLQVIVTETNVVSGRFVMTVEDPSGSVEISIPSGEALPAYVPGAEFESITGVLVPSPGIAGVWQLRPRSAADLVLD